MCVSFNLNSNFDTSKIKQEFKTKSLHGQTKDAFSKNKIGAWHYDVVEAGFRCNMTDLQAAIGLVELERYEETLEKRKFIFNSYDKAFKNKSWAITPISETANKISSFHLYLLRILDISENQRNKIIEKINSFFGYRAIHFIRINQNFTPKNTYMSKKTISKFDNILLDQKKNEIKDTTQKINDKELEQSLLNLGLSIANTEEN